MPTARVMQILRELTDELVKIDVTAESITIRSGFSEFRLSAEDPADFPPVANFEDEEYFILPKNEFRQAIRRTIFATDPSDDIRALALTALVIAGGDVERFVEAARRDSSPKVREMAASLLSTRS